MPSPLSDPVRSAVAVSVAALVTGTALLGALACRAHSVPLPLPHPHPAAESPAGGPAAVGGPLVNDLTAPALR
ncbi:hypothetical protein [Streptomyces sp. NPDC000134]|uniref:hypothetical protein n=1 Tax=Streptomyces sp. NPDC000134 TaxID=3364536 RepID=UPI0036BEA569